MAGSTPIYGFPYPQSTDLVADYPTLGQELATDVETVISGLGSGLNLRTPTSIANSGGSASASGGAVSFTGVSSISLNGIFSSTYDNYRIVMHNVGSADAGILMRLRSAGTDRTGADYSAQRFLADGATVSATAADSQTAFTFASISHTSQNNMTMDLFLPFISSAATTFTSDYYYSVYVGRGGAAGSYATANSNDGITLYPGSGTITGTIRVYGYKN